MYIKENEYLTVVLPEKSQLDSWNKKLGYYPEFNRPIKIHWTLLRTTKFRNLKLTLKCDDCQAIHNRRIRDLNPNKEVHYCNKCFNKGKRNGMYGIPPNENFLLGAKKLLEEKGNPFTWDSTKATIKKANVWEKIAKLNTGKKRTQETKDKMSKATLLSYKEGRQIPGKRWGKIITKQYKGLDYQSSYELKFLLFVESLNLLHLIERGPKISYNDKNGKKHSYFSDFSIKNNNIVFEIKSTYTWKKNLEINLLKKEASEKKYNYILVMDNRFKNVKQILKPYNKL